LTVEMTLQTEEMNWPSIRKAVNSGFKTVIVPIGSIEQHGLHLPTFTDALLAHHICEKLAEKLGRTLVAPVIRPGCSEHHLAFPGTISIPPNMLRAIVDSYVGSLMRTGFKNFVLIPTHGGNFEPLRSGLSALKKKYRRVKVFGYFDLPGFMNAMNEITSLYGISPEAS